MTHTRRKSWRWALLVVPLIALAVGLVWLEPAPASATSFCVPARPHASGDFAETIVSGGETRDYLLHIPPSYVGNEQMPLVFNWHGLGVTASDQQQYSELPAKADAAGFIVVAPQRLVSQAQHNFTKSPARADDVAFTGDILDELQAELCIDSARVFSTGMSNGAQMSIRLACNLSERIAAVAPVAGAYYPPFAVGFQEPGCVSTRPAALIAFHGTADEAFPFTGGQGIFGLIYRSFEDEIMPDWAEHNGCAIGPVHEPVTANVRLVRYEGCDENATVELYVVQDGGHTWPGAVGATQEISANDLMWDFFQAHPLATVGGVAELPEVAGTPLEAPGSSGTSAGVLAVIATGVVAIASAAWYARRRRLG